MRLNSFIFHLITFNTAVLKKIHFLAPISNNALCAQFVDKKVISVYPSHTFQQSKTMRTAQCQMTNDDRFRLPSILSLSLNSYMLSNWNVYNNSQFVWFWLFRIKTILKWFGLLLNFHDKRANWKININYFISIGSIFFMMLSNNMKFISTEMYINRRDILTTRLLHWHI